MAASDNDCCVRCGRNSPEFSENEPDEWVYADDELVCPNCVTEEEWDELAHGSVSRGWQLTNCIRCGRECNHTFPDNHGWQMVVGGIVCSGCRTTKNKRRLVEEDLHALEGQFIDSTEEAG